MFIFLRNILTGVFSVDDADEEQSKLFGKLSDTNIDKNRIEKKNLKCKIPPWCKADVPNKKNSDKIPTSWTNIWQYLVHQNQQKKTN